MHAVRCLFLWSRCWCKVEHIETLFQSISRSVVTKTTRTFVLPGRLHFCCKLSHFHHENSCHIRIRRSRQLCRHLLCYESQCVFQQGPIRPIFTFCQHILGQWRIQGPQSPMTSAEQLLTATCWQAKGSERQLEWGSNPQEKKNIKDESRIVPISCRFWPNRSFATFCVPLDFWDQVRKEKFGD